MNHPPAVIAKNLVVRRGSAITVNGLSCHLRHGELTALLGPNGCGKTTFARCILGMSFFGPEGSLEILGHKLGECDMRLLRKKIGFVSPTTGPEGQAMGCSCDADLSALEAVYTGFFGTIGLYEVPTDEQKKRAVEILEKIGLGHRLQVPLFALSSGEQRKCLIARAMAQKPELLILDEPTAGLDLRAREQVLHTVEHILAGENPPAILMITHHIEELTRSTKHVIVMKQGEVLAEGKPENVLTNENLSAAFNCKVAVRRAAGRFYAEVLPEAWLDF